MTYKSYYAVLAMALAFSGTVAKAANLAPPCTANTLTFYEDNYSDGGACSVGILNVSDFYFLSSDGGIYSDSQIEVAPVNNSMYGTGFTFCLVESQPGCANPTLNPFVAVLGDVATYNIGYDFVIDSGPQGTAATVGMDPPRGDDTVNQYYCADSDLSQDSATSAPTCSDSSPQVLTATTTTIPPDLFTSAPLVPAVQGFAQLDTMINVDGSTVPSTVDSVTEGTFITVAPEPSTLLFATGGLLTLAVIRRLC